jgi:hypothetical protein
MTKKRNFLDKFVADEAPEMTRDAKTDQEIAAKGSCHIVSVEVQRQILDMGNLPRSAVNDS